MEPTDKTFAPAFNQATYNHTLTSLKSGRKIIVVGAGIFGCCTALALLQKGFEVTVIDTWGAGNSRSSSSDETRVVRSTYGNNEVYFDLNVRSMERWKDFQKKWNKKIFYNTGVLWLCHEECAPLVDHSIPFAKKHGMDYTLVAQSELQNKFPQIRSDDLHHAYLDPFGGYVKARVACQLVLKEFQDSGGQFIQSHVMPFQPGLVEMEKIKISDGSWHEADLFVFACGSWLGKLFPGVLGNLISCTKQEVYYFGVPPNLSADFETIPVWVDVDGKDYYYGIPSHENRGFKIGVDKRGVPFDPTSGERILDHTVLRDAREFLTHRFPQMKDAPLLESRVCPYENTPDGNFIIDHHPSASNVLMVGGGSGHGFKHGPALGELIAEALSDGRKLPDIFSLKRFGIRD